MSHLLWSTILSNTTSILSTFLQQKPVHQTNSAIASHASDNIPTQDKINHFLDLITAQTTDEKYYEGQEEEEEEEYYNQTHQEEIETQEEFEEKKRKLMILLDQAVLAKMKIQKAFPQKLEYFGDTSRFGLNWHPGWREPERYVPEGDSDPYRGACAVSSCDCDMFETWPEDTGAYVYNPRIVNPETALCYRCTHLKSYHVLKTEKNRNDLKEFSKENENQYSVQYRQDLPPQHPADIPQYDLEKFYENHPEHPGAHDKAKKVALADIEEDQPRKTLADADVDQDLFGEGLGESF